MFTQAISPEVTEESIARLVQVFYDKARADDLIGPIFNENVDDWEHHLAKITDFWSSVVLRSGRYDGRPLPPHLRLPLIGEHFDRWLDLFEQTTLEIWEPDAAKIFIDRARRVADSFEMARATMSGEVKSPRHYSRPLPAMMDARPE